MCQCTQCHHPRRLRVCGLRTSPWFHLQSLLFETHASLQLSSLSGHENGNTNQHTQRSCGRDAAVPVVYVHTVLMRSWLPALLYTAHSIQCTAPHMKGHHTRYGPAHGTAHGITHGTTHDTAHRVAHGTTLHMTHSTWQQGQEWSRVLGCDVHGEPLLLVMRKHCNAYAASTTTHSNCMPSPTGMWTSHHACPLCLFS